MPFAFIDTTKIIFPLPHTPPPYHALHTTVRTERTGPTLFFTLLPLFALLLSEDELGSIRSAFSTIKPGQTAQTDTITAVFADSRWSHLEFGSDVKNATVSVSPKGNPHDIVSPHLTPFGRCREQRGTLKRKGRGGCGYVADLRLDGNLLDLLDFDTLTLHGNWKGRWRVALADVRLSQLDDNVTLGYLDERDIAPFHLAKVLPSLDLQRVRSLVLILDSDQGSVSLNRISLSRTPAAASPLPPPAVWLWKQALAVESAAAVVDDLVKKGIGRVYLQIGDDTERLRPFISLCRKKGVQVYALDGYPTAPLAPQWLLAQASRVTEHNTRFPEERFDGFQIDVEPHLAPDFRTRTSDYGHGMITLAGGIKERLGVLPLSLVIPFWYDSVRVDDRSLLWHLARRSDELVLMSYRTDGDEAVRLSREEIRTGEKLGIPVRIGVETGRLPDERHITFRRCPPDSPGAVAGGGEFWCAVSRVDIPGNRLSFYGNPEGFRQRLGKALPSPAFAGWVIHSYETIPR
ncbi:MAG: hypothetical protein Fur0034_00280 [Desulfuromonadia bacterium]